MNDQKAQLEAMKRELLLKFLDKEAFERIGRVKLANPMLAEQVELYLIQLFQSGQLKERLSDTKLKEILNLLTAKKETKIMRR